MRKHASEKYRELRSELVLRGTTLRRWATESGYPISSVYDAIRGTRKGPRSLRIMHQLEEYLA